MLRPDGTNVVQLTSNADADNQPEWSPNGKRIAFNRVSGGTNQLYVMNADGTGQAPVPNTAGGSNQVWSPDGVQLAFVRFGAGGSDLFLVKPDGADTCLLTFGEAEPGSTVEPEFDPAAGPVIAALRGFRPVT